jgi:hypothetical protein
MTDSNKSESNIKTEAMEGGFSLAIAGRVVAHLRGEDGKLTAHFVAGSDVDEDKQACFEKCFAASDQTTGASLKCSKKCGLT